MSVFFDFVLFWMKSIFAVRTNQKLTVKPIYRLQNRYLPADASQWVMTMTPLISAHSQCSECMAITPILSLYSTTCTLSRAWNPWRVSTSGSRAFLPVSHILTSLLDHTVEAGAEEKKKIPERGYFTAWLTDKLFVFVVIRQQILCSFTPPPPPPPPALFRRPLQLYESETRMLAASDFRLPVAPQGRSRKEDRIDSEASAGSVLAAFELSCVQSTRLCSRRNNTGIPLLMPVSVSESHFRWKPWQPDLTVAHFAFHLFPLFPRSRHIGSFLVQNVLRLYNKTSVFEAPFIL